MRDHEFLHPTADFTLSPNQLIRCGKMLTLQERAIAAIVLSWTERRPDNPAYGTAWIYNYQMSEWSGLSVRQVRRHTASLHKKGAVIVTPQFSKDHNGNDRQDANLYRVVPEFFPPDSAVRGEPEDTNVLGELEDASVREGRTQTTVGGGQERPGGEDKNVRDLRTRTSHNEETLPKKTSEENLSNARSASRETEDTTSSPSQGVNDEDTDLTLCIPDSMHKQRFIALVQSWTRDIGAHNLTKDKLLVLYKIMGLQESKAGLALDPVLVIPAARDRKLTLTHLFSRSGSGFVWSEIQTGHATLAPSSAFGGVGGAVGSSAPAAPALVAPERQETASVGTNEHALAQLGAARQRVATRKRTKTWPAEQVAGIYAAYPRKVGRGPALTAIEKRLVDLRDNGHDDPYGYLLGRVQLYAKSDAGNRGTYTPHPSTWFNQIRDTDNEAEWNPTVEDRSGSIPRIIEDTELVPTAKSLTNQDLLTL